MGLACWIWKGLEPVLDEGIKGNFEEGWFEVSMGHGKGGNSKPSTQRTELARRKLGPGKQLSLGGESQVSRPSLGIRISCLPLTLLLSLQHLPQSEFVQSSGRVSSRHSCAIKTQLPQWERHSKLQDPQRQVSKEGGTSGEHAHWWHVVWVKLKSSMGPDDTVWVLDAEISFQ